MFNDLDKNSFDDFHKFTARESKKYIRSDREMMPFKTDDESETDYQSRLAYQLRPDAASGANELGDVIYKAGENLRVFISDFVRVLVN
ncbi:MAG: hypothetical protein IAF08_09490 [Rhizobacter sp.]|nr:hypothetical protein [Chlorobiales bacterium]